MICLSRADHAVGTNTFPVRKRSGWDRGLKVEASGRAMVGHAGATSRAPDDATADYLHEVFEPTSRAIDGLQKTLAGPASSTKPSPWTTGAPGTTSTAPGATPSAPANWPTTTTSPTHGRQPTTPTELPHNATAHLRQALIIYQALGTPDAARVEARIDEQY
jgi:hypothetical protein